MFGIGTTEILIILVVALIVIGPKKLPEVARTLGKALGEFKKMSSDVKRTIDLEAERAEEQDKTSKAEKELFSKKKDRAEETGGPEPEIVEEGKDDGQSKTPSGSAGMPGKEA
ncbi:Sec-independent protein translocase protein TatB [Desulfoplanes sp.]